MLEPQTYMNDAGRSVGPARGELQVALDHVLVLHDEIDLPFGEIRTRLGGGLAGHNGLKSIQAALGSPDFARVRVGVGRPPTDRSRPRRRLRARPLPRARGGGRRRWSTTAADAAERRADRGTEGRLERGGRPGA